MSSPGTGTAPGVLSPFDLAASTTGEGQALGSMVNRYQQLGLGETGATPTDPGGFGLGSTAMGMDVGALPSLTGGIPGEFTAGQGEAQTNDLATALALARSNLNTGASNKGTLLGGVNTGIGKTGG